MEFKLKTPGLEDYLTFEEIEKYHDLWREWDLEHSEKESRLLAQCARDEQVVIRKVFQFTEEDASSLEKVKGDLVIFRSRAIQSDLRKGINPYHFGKEKQYIYPFWHEYHVWQIAEQLTHASRNKWCIGNNAEIYELIISPKTYFDISGHLFFHKDISV